MFKRDSVSGNNNITGQTIPLKSGTYKEQFRNQLVTGVGQRT